MPLGEILSVIDTQAFALFGGHPIDLCSRNKNIVVLLSQGTASTYPWARAISINDAGEINATPTGALELFEQHGRDLGLIHWNENIFVAMTNGSDGSVMLVTFSVSDAGVIPGSVTDSLLVNYAANLSQRSSLFKPHDTVLLTAECLSNDPRHIESFIISPAGSFTNGFQDSLELSTQQNELRLRQSSGDRMVGACTVSFDIHIFTFSCNSSGAMPAVPTDTWTPFTSASHQVSLCRVSDTVYAIFTFDDDDKVRIRTFSVDAAGSITKSFDHVEVVDDADGGWSYMTEMGFGYFVVAYSVAAVPGRLKTYFIADDGTITGGHISSFDITLTTFDFSSIVFLQDNIWAMAYQNSANEIMIYTLEMVTPTEAGAHHLMAMGIGP